MVKALRNSELGHHQSTTKYNHLHDSQAFLVALTNMFARFSHVLPLIVSIPLISSLKSPLPDHDVHEQVWIVPITPGGPTVTVNGTVQQLFKQLTKINPNYEAEFPPQTPDIGQPRSDSDKRDIQDHMMGRYSCAYDFYGVGLGFIRSEFVERGLVEYLDKVPGSPKLAPVSCSRVSCDLAQGIWWCNHVSSLGHGVSVMLRKAISPRR